MLDVEDLLQTQGDRGVVNILAADALLQRPMVYSTFLLWLLAELYERLPEVGDREKPKLVFFVTQSPLDIPDRVLGQLGNRVQHALRAFTPRDQKAVASVAETMRPNPALDVKAVISELGVGEALISMLDEKGTPGITRRAMIHPPASRMGPITPERRAQLIQGSLVAGVYEQLVDRESAFEKLSARAATAAPQAQPQGPGTLSEFLFGSIGPRGGQHPGVVDSLARSAARSVGSTVARELTRGLLGSLLGGKRRG
jgi:DNA helicase HerA-like ATPase